MVIAEWGEDIVVLGGGTVAGERGDPGVGAGGGSSQPPYMRSRLKAKADYWRSIGASPMVMGWILVGFLAWFTAPVPVMSKPNQPSCFEPTAHTDFITSSVTELMTRGVIGVWDVAKWGRPRVISPLKVVPKKGNKYRLVLDLSRLNMRLNDYMHFPKFKYDSIRQVSDVFELGDFCFTADLKDGYWHCDLHVDMFT